jgi:serine/threonine protein kinase
LKPGDVIAARYKLLRPIGKGAMGTVWAARHELLGRDFALKFARVPAQTDSAIRTRFQLEAQLVGKLRHPNIVDVTDFGEVSPDGDFFLAMELLEGESLAERIEHRGRLESYEAVTIAADVARGLVAVHSVGIVHRDVKPENIFLARSPTGNIVPKLLDFGISKERNDSLTTQQGTQQGTLTGTPAYMSPEQAIGETKLDPRTDIWSLGVVLYEMLMGKHPFVEQNYQALMTAIAERPHDPLDPTLPAAVCRIVDRCLDKRPNDRYSSSEELADALLSVAAGALTASPRSRTQTRRRKLGFVLAFASALLLVASVYVWIAKHSTAPTPHIDTSPRVEMTPSAETSTVPVVEPPSPLAPSPSISAVIAASARATAPLLTTTRPAARTRDKRSSTSVTTPGF